MRGIAVLQYCRLQALLSLHACSSSLSRLEPCPVQVLLAGSHISDLVCASNSNSVSAPPAAQPLLHHRFGLFRSATVEDAKTRTTMPAVRSLLETDTVRGAVTQAEALYTAPLVQSVLSNALILAKKAKTQLPKSVESVIDTIAAVDAELGGPREVQTHLQ